MEHHDEDDEEVLTEMRERAVRPLRKSRAAQSLPHHVCVRLQHRAAREDAQGANAGAIHPARMSDRSRPHLPISVFLEPGAIHLAVGGLGQARSTIATAQAAVAGRRSMSWIWDTRSGV